MESGSTNALELVLQYIVAPMVPLLFGAATVALGKLVSYLHAKEAESRVARYSAVAGEAARSVVAELDVTLRPKLQAALADGKLTDSETAELKLAAMTALRKQLPGAVLGGAEKVFGGLLDTWLSGLVERAVTERQALQGFDHDATPVTTVPVRP